MIEEFLNILFDFKFILNWFLFDFNFTFTKRSTNARRIMQFFKGKGKEMFVFFIWLIVKKNIR